MGWQPGEILGGRHRLEQRLGAYGNRQTWLAFDGQSGQPVVLKALRFAPGERTWQEQRLALREAETLGSLSLSAVPHLREWFEFSEPTGTYFCLVLDYIPGESLAARVRRGGPLSAGQARDLAAEVLDVLQALHAFAPPVVHRDIKPDNLILREGDGRVCLVDFGSVQAETAAGQTRTVVGTHGYMAPEQFAGLAGPAADLYSLGATVLFALSGKSPADWPRRGLQLQLRGQGVADENLCAWLAQMLEPDPSDRFSDSAQALAALRKADTAGLASAVPQPPDSRPRFTFPDDDDSRPRFTLSYDRGQVELRNTDDDLWRDLTLVVYLVLSVLGVGTGLYWGGLGLAFFALCAFAVGAVVPGSLIFLTGLQWRLVFDGKRRWLLRTFFGRVLERWELPASLQVATREEGRVYSVALVTPKAKRHRLGQYNKTEAEQLAQLLRTWLDETDW